MLPLLRLLPPDEPAVQAASRSERTSITDFTRGMELSLGLSI
jgi:hypothetical protein